MRKVTTLLLCSVFWGTVFSQPVSNIDRNQTLDPLLLENLYEVTDTLTQNLTSVTLKVNWMDTEIEIIKTTNLVYDLEYLKKFRRDSTYYPSKVDSLRFMKMREVGSQNCHSYALQKYFEFIGLSESPLFNNRTVLTDNWAMQNILNTAFFKIAEWPTKNKRKLNSQFSTGTLLIFRNQSNAPIHTVYYDGQYHSKNGVFPAKKHEKISDILKTYWDTKTIEEYIIDYEKISAHSLTIK